MLDKVVERIEEVCGLTLTPEQVGEVKTAAAVYGLDCTMDSYVREEAIVQAASTLVE